MYMHTKGGHWYSHVFILVTYIVCAEAMRHFCSSILLYRVYVYLVYACHPYQHSELALESINALTTTCGNWYDHAWVVATVITYIIILVHCRYVITTVVCSAYVIVWKYQAGWEVVIFPTDYLKCLRFLAMQAILIKKWRTYLLERQERNEAFRYEHLAKIQKRVEEQYPTVCTA